MRKLRRCRLKGLYRVTFSLLTIPNQWTQQWSRMRWIRSTTSKRASRHACKERITVLKWQSRKPRAGSAKTLESPKLWHNHPKERMDLLMRKRSLFLRIVMYRTFPVTGIHCNAMLLKVKLIAGVSVKGSFNCMKEEWRGGKWEGRVWCAKDGQELKRSSWFLTPPSCWLSILPLPWSVHIIYTAHPLWYYAGVIDDPARQWSCHYRQAEDINRRQWRDGGHY